MVFTLSIVSFCVCRRYHNVSNKDLFICHLLSMENETGILSPLVLRDQQSTTASPGTSEQFYFYMIV